MSPEIAEAAPYWQQFGYGIGAGVGAVLYGIYRFITGRKEVKEITAHVPDLPIADMRPLYILLERNVVAVEKNGENGRRVAEATDRILSLIDTRLTDDEIDRKANERAQDRFDRMKDDYAKGERTQRREGSS